MRRTWRGVSALVLLSVWLTTGCSSDDGSDATTGPAQIPSTQTMVDWIAEIVDQGIRRPGYAADEWAENWSRERFEEFGLQDVTLDPIDVWRWEPLSWSLEVWNEEDPQRVVSIPSYPIPMSADAAGLEAGVELAGDDEGTALAGKIAVLENNFIALPQRGTQAFATWSYDPANEFDELVQILPFSAAFQDAMEPAIEAGAVGFIGILRGLPWDTDRYYVPYDGLERSIPGLWLSSRNGDRLLELIAEGPVRARVVLERSLVPAISHNVTGTLPGASDQWIIIGSHHDGPWASAVEDGSGIALVMAQARYWSQVPRSERPHNLMFLLNGGHMSGGAGLIHFVESNRDFLERDVVVEIHLEHAASEARGEGGVLVATDRPEPRWWFTSFIPTLEQAVADAICKHELERSFLMPPEGFPPGSANPPTDAAFFHPHAPIVSFLTAPMYLFDEADTLDKVHEPSLVPLTRATIDIVNALADQSAASLRAQIYAPPRAMPLVCEGEADDREESR
jgi:hypothetical protein